MRLQRGHAAPPVAGGTAKARVRAPLGHPCRKAWATAHSPNFKGSLKEAITAGATVKVVLKLGAITILTEEHNFCDDAACPIDAGDSAEIFIRQTVPADAPTGKFAMVTTLTKSDGSLISCITMPVLLISKILVSQPDQKLSRQLRAPFLTPGIP